jgi:hypothetical protein
MVFLLVNITASAVVGFLVLRYGRDPRTGSIRRAHWLRITALIPLGFQVAIFLLFGVGEMAAGDMSGAGHLLQVAVVAPLGLVAWMRPFEGGIAILIAGSVSAIFYLVSGLMFPAILILASPQIVSGVLFFIAGVESRSL